MITRRAFIIGTSAAAAATQLTWPGAAFAQTTGVTKNTFAYASPGGNDLLLDLFLPQGAKKPLPVIVFIHGGGWSGGNRATGPDFKRFFARDGFAIASIEYRLTAPGVAFPANAEDVKTSLRWLRAHASEHGLNPDRIGLWGTSAGGLLSGIAALSPRGMFEGSGNLSYASTVQCVLDAYGPSSLLVMDAETEAEKATLQPLAAGLVHAPPLVGGVVVEPGTVLPPGRPRGTGIGDADPPHDDPQSNESRLVGAPIQSVPEKSRAASPLTYVSGNAPPFLLMHGLADNSVPHTQSVLMYEALAKANNDVTLRLVDGLPHTFFNRTNLDELAGPFRMDVREHPKGGPERTRVDRANCFDVARAFFVEHLA